jgi:hypothetical protein
MNLDATLRDALAPFHIIGTWLSLPPDNPFPGVVLLAGFIVIGELVRVLLSTELTRSRIVHVAICLLTFAVPAFGLAAVLVFAARAHPERAWTNLAFAAGLYALWWLAGESTRLARSDTEGADVGFMSVGAVFTFGVGIAAAIAVG